MRVNKSPVKKKCLNRKNQKHLRKLYVLHAHVPCVLTCSRVNLPCVLTYSSGNMPCVLRCSRTNALCVPCVVTWQRALRAHVQKVSIALVQVKWSFALSYTGMRKTYGINWKPGE